MTARQEQTTAKMDAGLAEMKDGQKEMVGNQKVTEANPEKMEANSDGMASVAVHEKVPKEEAAVKSFGALKQRRGEIVDSGRNWQPPAERRPPCRSGTA